MSSFNESELRYFWGVSAEFRQLMRNADSEGQLHSCVEELRGRLLHTRQPGIRKQCREMIEEFEVRTSPLAQLPAQQFR
jgi:hypothetical protein